MRLPSDTFELAMIMGRRLDGAQSYLDRWLRYYDGTQPGAYMSPDAQEALSGRLPMLSVNFARLCVLSLQERLRIVGFLLDGATEPDPDIAESWARSGMDDQSDQIHAEHLIFGRAYGLAWVTEEGDPLLSAESPLSMTTITDPATRRVRAAMKRYWIRTDPDQPVGQGVALIMTDDRLVTLTTDDDQPISGYPPMGGAWRVAESLPNPIGRPPAILFCNGYQHSTHNAIEGESELADLAPLVDAIAKLGQDLMVSSEVAARPRRWATGLELVAKRDPQTGAEVVDSNGEPVFINPFSSDATRLWQSSNPDTSFGTFAAADLTSYGQAISVLTSQVGAISTLPAHYLGVHGDQPPSADAIRSAEASLTSRASGKIRSLTPAWSQFAALEVALRTGRDPSSVRAVPLWADPSTRTPDQSADAAVKLGSLGVPTEVVLRETLGWSSDQIAELREARMREAVDRAALATPPPAPLDSSTVPPTTEQAAPDA